MSRSFVKFVPLVVSVSLFTACAAPNTTSAPADPKSGSDVTLASDSPEASAILALLNDGATTVELLDQTVELDSRAAKAIVEHRDGADARPGTSDDDRFDSLHELDLVPYVGPVALGKLSTFAAAQGWVSAAPGTFEGVGFTAKEVTVALDLINNAPQSLLDVDAALDARAAQHIVDARPIHSLTDLAAVSWVGPSAMRKIHGFLPFWEAATQTPEIYDGVVFTTQQAANALAAANDAEPQAFSAAGIAATQRDIIVTGRPWLSVEDIALAHGIGSVTMTHLRDLGATFTAQPYLLGAGDAAEFAANVKLEVTNDDSAWIEAFALQLDGDLSGDASFATTLVDKTTAALGAHIDAYAGIATGRTYSSRPAAQAAFFQFAMGLESTVTNDYPDGALSVVPELTEAQALVRAKIAMLYGFEHTEVNQPDFQANVGRTWADVKDQVKADVTNFDTTTNYQVFRDGHVRIFAGTVYGLHTEATVDDLGKVTHLLFEVD